MVDVDFSNKLKKRKIYILTRPGVMFTFNKVPVGAVGPLDIRE